MNNRWLVSDMKKTKVICSVGPACNDVKTMTEMVNVGMNCARINLSHSTEEQMIEIIESVRQVRQNTGYPIAIMYDTKGPEFRTMTMANDGISLDEGSIIKMVKNNDAEKIFNITSYANEVAWLYFVKINGYLYKTIFKSI